MRTEDTMPPPLPAAIEDLLASERVLVAQPEMVRARALARAREALRDSPEGARSRSRVALARGSRPILAAAAGVAILAGTAAAFQMIRRSALVPHTEAPQVPRPPAAVSSPAAPAFALDHEATPGNVVPAFPKADSPTRKPAFAGKREGGLEEFRRSASSPSRCPSSPAPSSESRRIQTPLSMRPWVHPLSQMRMATFGS